MFGGSGVVIAVVAVVAGCWRGCDASEISCNDTLGCAYSSSVLTYDTILCEGYRGCYESDLDCDTYCECNGLLACHGSEITAGNNVVCDGEYGCKYAHITADGGIWCDGQYGCKFTELTADGNIYCGGEYGCRLSEIFGANYLYAIGSEALSETDIYGISRIYGYGYLALNKATVNTTGQSTVIAYLGGRQTGYDADFICADGSTCYIYCQNSDSCENLDVYCYGTCSIDCDDDCDTCPTEISEDKGYDMHEMGLKLEKKKAKRSNARQQRGGQQRGRQRAHDASFVDIDSTVSNYNSKTGELITAAGIGFALCLVLVSAVWFVRTRFFVSKDGTQYQSLL